MKQIFPLIQNNGPQDTQDLETGFNSLALESEGFASTKKIWGVEDKHSDDTKGLFMADSHQWGRDSTWSSAPASGNNANENGVLSEHAVSQPIMVKRSGFVGNDGTLLSPRSTDTGGIGMKMAEYVLNNSPSKDNLESRIHSRLLRDHDKVSSQNVRKGDKDVPNVSHQANSNGLSNGFGTQEDVNSIDSNKLFNRAPGIGHQIDDNDDLHKNHIGNMMSGNKSSVIDGMMHLQGVGHQPQFTDFGSDQLTSGAIGIDALPSFVGNDYVNTLMPSVNDSPNLMDAYYQQQRNAASGNQAGQANNQLSLLSNQQQHLNLSAQQQNQGLVQSGTVATIGHPSATSNTNLFTAATQNAQNPYFSDPFAMSMINANATGHLPVSPYYGFHPWNMYPGIMQNATQSGGQLQGQSGHPTSMQQQQTRQNNNQQNAPNRPMSPNNLQNSNEQNTTNAQALAALQAAQAAGQPGFSMIPLPGTSGFYDQNSLSALAAAGRGIPSAPMHRIMPQMNMLQNPSGIGNGNMRMIPNVSNQNGTANQTQNNSLFASNGPNNASGNNIYTSVTNSGIGYNNMSSGTMFSANGHTNNQGLAPQQMGFHNPGLF